MVSSGERPAIGPDGALWWCRTAVAKAPVVVSLVGKTGMPLAVPALRNTRLPDYAVTGAVAPAQVKVRPNLDLLERA